MNEDVVVWLGPLNDYIELLRLVAHAQRAHVAARMVVLCVRMDQRRRLCNDQDGDQGGRPKPCCERSTAHALILPQDAHAHAQQMCCGKASAHR